MKKLLVLLVTLPLLFQCSDNDRIVNLPEDAEPYYSFVIESPGDNQSLNFQGGFSFIPVYLDSIGDQPLTNFDLSIAYEDTILTVRDVIPSEALECWEYFNYSVNVIQDEQGNSLECLSINAISNLKSIYGQPTGCSGVKGEFVDFPTKLFDIKYYVKDNREYECHCVPIYFYWLDCNDNSVNDANYSIRYVSQNVYDIAWVGENQYTKLIPDNNYVSEDEHIYGVFTDCMAIPVGSSSQITPVIDFYDSWVCLSCSEPQPTSGDINLNNVAYEIEDARLYAAYFIYGNSAFRINLLEQTEESDVNRDEEYPTLADFVYLVRILYGDAVAWSSLQHYQSTAYISVENDTVYVECDRDLGAVAISFYDRVNSKSLLESFTLKDDYFNGFTNVIIYKMGRMPIPAGKTPLMVLSEFAFIHKFETAGYYGESVTAVIKQ